MATTFSSDAVTLGRQLNTSEVSDTAFALLDEGATVIGWTQAARQLSGFSAAEAVGRSAALVLPHFGAPSTMSAFVERCRARDGWSGTTAVRHRDGHTVGATVRISAVRGRDGAPHWLMSLVNAGAPASDPTGGSVRGPLLTRAPIGIVIRDPQLRCVYANDVMERHDGLPHDRRLGTRFADERSDAESEAIEGLMRQVLQSGTVKVHEYRVRFPADPGPEHPFAVSFQCLQGADGRALGVCVISTDVCESRRAHERLAALGEAGARLGSTLDVMQAGQELADLALPLLADYVAVDLEQSVSFGEGPPVRIGTMGARPPGFRRAGVASIRPGVPESPWLRGEPIGVPPGSPLHEVLRTGRSRLEPAFDVTLSAWAGATPELARRLGRSGAHSVMVVPIRARRMLLGTALFVRTADPAPFQKVDLLLAEELVARAARSLDHARRYTREHTAALTLQRTLLPRQLQGGAAVETASLYLPADVDHCVGGDWFDVIPLSGGRVALVVGDVVGHGLHAAVTMGRLRTAVHTLADMELPPDELLTRLDDTLQRLADGDEHDTPAGMGATCLYAVYDPATRRCTMAGAGHPPPAVVDPQGRASFPDLPTGAPLGIGLGDPFESVEIELPEGSLLALYTDGLIEHRDHDIEEGMRRLGTVLTQPGRSLDDLCALVAESRRGQSGDDDVSLLLVRTRSLGADRVASWTLPVDRTVVRRARNLAAHQLASWGLQGVQDRTTLIVSELVTNALRHGTGPIELRLIRHQSLTCEVFDTDNAAPRVRRAHPMDETGRGLYLVTQLSRRWGSRPLLGGGKAVWAEVDLPAIPAPRSPEPSERGRPRNS
ncbi:SpoIIE family protein phosphatase [Streptomyces sp. NPDC005722]